jgi:glycosyltransferase involved in cell wall biosynthesis
MTRPLRILQCVGDINPALGGSVEAARQLSLALARLGHSPELVTVRPIRPEWMENWRGRAYFAGPAATRYLYTSRLKPWMEQHAAGYDAVFIHGLWRYTGWGVARGLHGAGTPSFVFPHGMLDPYFKRASPLKHLQKLVCWLAAERRVIRDARAVLFTCEEERRSARTTYPAYRCSEKVVGMGIEAPPADTQGQRDAFFAEFPALSDRRVVLFLGRLHPKKGCDLLVQALARVARADPRLHLVIAGPDECGLRANLEQQARSAGVGGRVTFSGPLYGARKWSALRAAEAVALPSHIENFGISLVEAMACGVPVLLSDRVNIWREIEADGAGLVSSDDLAGTTSLFERWLALSSESRCRMRDYARQSFFARYEASQFAARVLQVVEPEIARPRLRERHVVA